MICGRTTRTNEIIDLMLYLGNQRMMQIVKLFPIVTYHGIYQVPWYNKWLKLGQKIFYSGIVVTIFVFSIICFVLLDFSSVLHPVLKVNESGSSANLELL